MIHVFLCQSRKETHVEIGEMHISPILYKIYIPTLQLSIVLNWELDGLSFRMKDRYTKLVQMPREGRFFGEIKLMIHVFLCQSCKETHVEIFK